MSLPFELGRTWLELACWHKLCGEVEISASAAQAAREIFARLEAGLELARLEAEGLG